VSVVYCQVEVSATGRSLVQRSHSDNDGVVVVVSDRENSRIRRPGPALGCRARENVVLENCLYYCVIL
jgi:hypothetical protein